MRVHHLELTAFGPFAHTQRVDLESLGEAGLFLISGPTGSGKTSLLDAISFALFGSVPGSRGPKTLRSQHADVDAVPTVELEVTLSGRRLRIRRSPAFHRPGRKTAVQASVTLDEHRADGWHHVTGRLDEAGRVLEDVLGMTAEQFHRVVVLPQGDFAAFLHASNDERSGLLRRLFDVETFADVEAWLLDERRRLDAQARDASRDLERIRHSLGRVLSTLPAMPGGDALAAGPDPGSDTDSGSNSGVEAALADWGDLGPADFLGVVSALDARVQQDALGALTEADDADSAHRHAERTLTEARDRCARHDRGVEAAGTLAALDAELEEHRARTDQLDLARRADRALAHQAALERAEGHLGAASAAAQVAAQAAGVDLAEPDEVAIATWSERLSGHDDVIEELRHAGRQCRQAGDRVPRLADEVAQLSEARERLTVRHAKAVTRRDDAAAALATAEGAAAEMTELEESARALTRLITGRTELDELVGAAQPQAADDLREARDRAQAARETHQDLIQQRLDDMAGELAERLSPGDPCLVCGSPEHPEPAQRRTSVDGLAIEAAETAWRDQRERVEAAQTHLATLTARVEQLTSSLGDEPRDLATLIAEAAVLATTIAERRALAATVAPSQAALTTLQGEVTRLEEEQTTLAERLHRAESLLDEERRRLEASSQSIVTLLEQHGACPCSEGHPGGAEADHESLLERARRASSAHEDALGRARALEEARRSLDQARLLVEEAAAARDASLAEEQIADVETARAGLLSRAEQERLAAQVAEHTERRAAVTQVLDDPEVAAALDQPRPDVEARAAELEQARSRWQQATAVLGQVQHAAREIAEHHRQLADLVAAAGPLAERHELVAELADLASGRGEDNPDGIALTTYVLAVRLERIVALANERLSTMAVGRYELEVDHGRADRRSRGGLGLQVLDQWTGSHRPATTLSGGETFMVALALALGTADAVREESGGVDLQTLFIDEGFGSLDDEALEEVLAVLDDLRTSGRAVGVISHVADMRQRIPAQLRVRKTSTGSSIEVLPDVDAA